MTEVTNNPALKRYELNVDGHVATACYEIANGVITFEHGEATGQMPGKLIRGPQTAPVALAAE